MSVEELALDLDKQMALNLQLDKMTKQAFGDKIFSPKKLTPESEEAIKEYNAQFKIVEYERDEFGELVKDQTGQAIKKKKNIIPLPDLDPVPPLETLDFHGNYFGLRELGPLHGESGLKTIKDQIESYKEQLVILEKDKQHVLDLVNETGTTSLHGQEKVKRLMSYIPKIEKKIKDVGKKLDNIGRHQDDILQLEIDIKQIEAENEAKVQGVRNLNDRKIQSYLETIKALNTGGMNTEKISGETEEEYLDRIIANAEIDTPDQSIFDATEYAKRKFKEHMKELFRSESLIESVANQIQYIGNELKIKTSINKKFPIFKREFIETFGKNNKEITSGDIIEFIKAFITGETSIIKELKKIVTEVKDIKQEKEVKKPEIEKAPIESVFSIIGEKDIIYFMPILSDPEDGEEHYELLWSNSLNRHTFHELKSDISFKQIKKISGLKKSEILQQIKGNSPSFMAERLVQMGIQPITYNDKSKPFNSYDPEQDEIIYGWGIEPEKIPDIVPFGKCKLHLHKLYYKNNLVVKHKDNSNIIGLPNIIVSDEFVKLIMKLLKGEDIKQKDLNTLKTMELHLWNRLIVLAELHKKHPIESNKTIDHLKHQLELLTGEIEAGNDNKDLVKQLHQVVHSLKNFGAITSTSAKDFIKQYK